MTQKSFSVSISHHSQAGIGKPVNQDALIAYVPDDSLLTSKGAVFAVADGISTSQFGAEASQIAVSSFLNDYLDTPETWSAKTSGFKVLLSINSWLVAQSRQGGYSFNQNKGYVCAFAALIIKSRTIHIFHSGDVRVVMLHDGAITILTQDHRHVYDDERTYLSAALGLDNHIRLDYLSIEAQVDATYFLLSDGVHEYLNHSDIIQILEKLPDATCAQALCELAVTKGSVDDTSALVIGINDLPVADKSEFYEHNKNLTHITSLDKGAVIDGLCVVRPLGKTPRSHTYLVTDQSENFYVLKTPSAEKSQDNNHIESMLMEEWVARRLNSTHLMTAPNLKTPRSKLYTLSNYIEGQSLAQWMAEHPKPSLHQVRSIIQQIATGLQVMHRAEIIHRDLRPENILIDDQGTVTIIDFGEVSIAGLEGVNTDNTVPGSLQYTAPEYLLGAAGTAGSDVFSLGVLTYQILSGQLPYGLKLSSAHSKKAQHQLNIRSLLELGIRIPDWSVYAINKALDIDPKRRYKEVSEFMYELNSPSSDFKRDHKAAWIDRDPVRFWQGVSIVLSMVVVSMVLSDYW